MARRLHTQSSNPHPALKIRPAGRLTAADRSGFFSPDAEKFGIDPKGPDVAKGRHHTVDDAAQGQARAEAGQRTGPEVSGHEARCAWLSTPAKGGCW